MSVFSRSCAVATVASIVVMTSSAMALADDDTTFAVPETAQELVAGNAAGAQALTLKVSPAVVAPGGKLELSGTCPANTTQLIVVAQTAATKRTYYIASAKTPATNWALSARAGNPRNSKMDARNVLPQGDYRLVSRCMTYGGYAEHAPSAAAKGYAKLTVKGGAPASAPTSATAAPAASKKAPAKPGTLAHTGSDIAPLAGAGAGLLLGGAALVAFTKMRRRKSDAQA